MKNDTAIYLVLTGAHKDKTITLRGVEFIKGKTILRFDQMGLAKYLNRCYQAQPVTKEEFDGNSNTDTDTDADEREQGVSGDVRQDGEGTSKEAPTTSGEPSDTEVDTDPAGGVSGQLGELPQGSGQESSVDLAITEAIMQLNPKDDEHWTAAGAPAMSAVEKFYGSSDITRADINRVAKGVTRENLADFKGE